MSEEGLPAKVREIDPKKNKGPVRPEDQPVEEAGATEEESEDEAVNPEGSGAEGSGGSPE